MLKDTLSALFSFCFWNLYLLGRFEVNCQFEMQPAFCAQVWSNPYYCGKYIHVDQNEVEDGLDFFIGSAQVRPNCNLFVTNARGLEDVLYTNCPWKWLDDVNRLCCECNGCLEAVTPPEENACAVLYENTRCSACSGFRVVVNDTEEISSLDVRINDKISSLLVKPGCELFIYTEKNFRGNNATVTEPFEFLSEEWDNQISSLKCYCDRFNYPSIDQQKTTEKLPDMITSETYSSTVTVADTTVYMKPSTEPDKISTTEPADISTTEGQDELPLY